MRTISIVLMSLFLFSCGDSSKSPSTNNYSQKTETKPKETKPKRKTDRDKIAELKSQDCAKFISLLSAKELAREFGWTEDYVLRNHRINVWEKTTFNGKGKVVGKMYPGSNALLLERSGDDFKIVSPLDRSIGWVNEVQVYRTLYQNPKTNGRCK
tara:strand:- start:6610 stop:7074 length:465 start_codon:yes stop_codon:yes gene_type:complete